MARDAKRESTMTPETYAKWVEFYQAQCGMTTEDWLRWVLDLKWELIREEV